MTHKTTILACTITALCGIFLFSWHNEWIMFRTPGSFYIPRHVQKTKKTITLHYWHNNRWHKETEDILWSENKSDALFYLITSYLSVLDGEQITHKTVTLQSVCMAPNNQDAYISFDRSLFYKEWATYRKWMILEGLLKTIRENDISIQNIILLVHHQPLSDTHLDCSHPWPITGFLS